MSPLRGFDTAPRLIPGASPLATFLRPFGAITVAHSRHGARIGPSRVSFCLLHLGRELHFDGARDARVWAGGRGDWATLGWSGGACGCLVDAAGAASGGVDRCRAD